MNNPSPQNSYVAFADFRLLVQGPLDAVLVQAKRFLDQGSSEALLIFEQDSGRQVDFNFQGTEQDVLQRAFPEAPARLPGRPKLGVVSREVTLLPRHWAWLEQQPKSVSAVLRDLVEQAQKREPEKAQARRLRDALSRVLWSLAGNLEHFEESSRALFAADLERFKTLVAGWPEDLRVYALTRLEAAAALETAASRGPGILGQPKP